MVHGADGSGWWPSTELPGRQSCPRGVLVPVTHPTSGTLLFHPGASSIARPWGAAQGRGAGAVSALLCLRLLEQAGERFVGDVLLQSGFGASPWLL